MTKIRLRACPFCGSEAELNVTQDGVCVTCTRCIVQTTRMMDINEACTDAVREVIRGWNCRVGEGAEDDGE